MREVRDEGRYRSRYRSVQAQPHGMLSPRACRTQGTLKFGCAILACFLGRGAACTCGSVNMCPCVRVRVRVRVSVRVAADAAADAAASVCVLEQQPARRVCALPGVRPLARKPLEEEMIGRAAIKMRRQVVGEGGQVGLGHDDAVEAVGDAQGEPAGVVEVSFVHGVMDRCQGASGPEGG